MSHETMTKFLTDINSKMFSTHYFLALYNLIIPRSQSQSLYSGMMRLLPGYRESEVMYLDTIYDSPTMMAN